VPEAAQVQQYDAVPLVDARCSIGEGPVWDAAAGRLLWVDIPAGVVHVCGADGTSGRVLTLGGPVSAVVPTNRGGLVLASGVEILHVDPDGRRVDTIATLDLDPGEVRFNDGACDREGRFWVGTQSANGEPHPDPALYVLGPDLVLRQRLADVTISNGLDWSPDGATMYYVDTPTMGVDAFDFDDGMPRNRRRLITVEPGQGRPDGLCVDADGFLWVAHFYSGTVRRYSPQGDLVAQVRVSAPLVTSCAFGGSFLDTLYITTAKFAMPVERVVASGMPSALAAEAVRAPGAGALFAARVPGVRGLASTPFVFADGVRR
jgi:sugar lactone lactonase YvrE